MVKPPSMGRGAAPVRSCLMGLALLLSASLPGAWALAAEPTRFCIAADNRGHPGFVNVAEKIKEVPGAPVQFAVFSGDQDPATVTRAQLDAVFGKAFPWYPAVGNHDVNPEHASEMAYYRQLYEKQLAGKVSPGPAGTRETTYSFDAGDVHIVILNQHWNGKTEAGSDCTADAGVVKPLRDWLRADLAASRKPWKLVVGHTPVFFRPDKDLGTARHGTNDTFLSEDWKAFWSVLEEQGVAAYICSHTHRYSHFQPPASKVWQIDVAQARGDSTWQNDAFVIVTVTPQSLQFEVYRNLKKQGHFEVTDSLSLKAAGAQLPAAAAPAGK